MAINLSSCGTGSTTVISWHKLDWKLKKREMLLLSMLRKMGMTRSLVLSPQSPSLNYKPLSSNRTLGERGLFDD